MNPEDRDLLLRALDADLSAAERLRLEQLLAKPEARAAWHEHQRVRTAVAAAADASFGPFFADRVMQRLSRERAARRRAGLWEHLAERLAALSPLRVAGAGLAVAVLVAAVAVALWVRPHTLHVPYGELATVTLPDGSVVELGSGSTLTYAHPFGWKARRVRLEGEAFFSVVKGAAPFVVVTFNARVEVHGTRFNVRAWPEEPASGTSVALTEGRVAVAALASPAPPVVLAPGEMTTVAPDTTAPRRPAPAALGTVLAWRTGGIAFSDEPLASVARALERRFGVSVRLADAGLADAPVGYLQPRPAAVEVVLADICAAHNLRYRRTADGYEIVAP